VPKLIAGPNVFICDECVEVCNEIIAEDNRFARTRSEARERASNHDKAWPKPVVCALCLRAISQGDGIAIEKRGTLCTECVDAIKVANTASGADA
jgi:hypothetical protein